MKKFLTALLIVGSLFFATTTVEAEVKTYEGFGEYVMGERDTLETAKQGAKDKALRNALERAGVLIQAFARTEDSELVEDVITSQTGAILKVVEITYDREDFLVKAHVWVEIDADDINRRLEEISRKPKNASPSKTSQIPSDAVKYNGHHYYVFPSKFVTWEEAKSFCESLGGHLAIINDAVEDNFLFRYMKSVGVDIAYFGLTDTGHEGTWLWVDNTPLIYKNWGNTEPNGGTHENYVAYLAWVNPNGEWIDGFFNGAAGEGNFICEWDY